VESFTGGDLAVDGAEEFRVGELSITVEAVEKLDITGHGVGGG
jgi:hypothetical protein